MGPGLESSSLTKTLRWVWGREKAGEVLYMKCESNDVGFKIIGLDSFIIFELI
jgi:hypothetical protein